MPTTKSSKTTKTSKAAKAVSQYTRALGRRKSATAIVRVYDSKGSLTVNTKTLEEYFPVLELQKQVQGPLKFFDLVGKQKIVFTVKGGGPRGQAEACQLALARALVKMDETRRSLLRDKGFLTRDPRVKERKKFGLKKARRAPQWRKR